MTYLCCRFFLKLAYFSERRHSRISGNLITQITMLRQALLTNWNTLRCTIDRTVTRIGRDRGGIRSFLSRSKPDLLYRNISGKMFSEQPSSEMVLNNVSVIGDGNKVEVTWSDNKISRFHASWLRHNCMCEKCYSSVVNQSLIQIHKLPLDMKVKDAVISDKDRLLITWEDNSHFCEFCPSFLKQYCYSKYSLQKKKDLLKPKLYNQSAPPKVSWGDIVKDDEYVYRWLKDINEHGLSLITGAPARRGFLLEFLPERVAPPMDNLYGKVIDVIAEENPVNLAFTPNQLEFHMDQIFYESSPGMRILHCIKFDDSIRGGETILVDMFAISEEFRKSNPGEFHTLCTVPCTFSRIHSSRNDPVNLVMRRPIINLNKEEEIIGIFWNPPVTGPLQVNECDVDAFYRAYQMYAKAIDNFHTKIEVRLKPGEIIGFSNRRMAHGRNAFTSSTGQRHLQGSLISISDYTNRLYLLAKRYGDISSIKRFGNMDWL